MPREDEQPPPLSESPNGVTETSDQQESAAQMDQYTKQFVIVPQSQQTSTPMNLHPYTRPLTILDLEAVVALENAAFPNEHERATRDKVSRLRGGSSPALPNQIKCYLVT